VLAHLDKSHIAVHTYPESHPDREISTFRADIEVSTCGRISPLKALNQLILSFDSDVVIADYRVRGFTRDTRGQKHFIDHEINSIQDHVSAETKAKYHMVDVNASLDNMFHTKMIVKDVDLDDHVLRFDRDAFAHEEMNEVRGKLIREMDEIFYGRNMGQNHCG
jgi:S-adenosylmethionine decarboxylase